MTIAAVGGARAADPPTKKEVPPPPPVNGFESWWTYINSTPVDCPLAWGPFTVYATLDVGGGWESNGARASTTYPNSVANFISKRSYGSKWLWTPNGISQSVVGIKMSQPIAYGWSLVGRVETGFSPYSWNLANGALPGAEQSSRTAASRGERRFRPQRPMDNSQGFIGFSNRYGTSVGGRVNTLGLDGLVAYDPMGSAYAFSPFGYSGSYTGFGDTEMTRSNTAIKYHGDFMNFHANGLVQIGSYNQGNPSTSMYQGGVGAEFASLLPNTVVAGTFSFDAIGAYARTR